jgi:hypothetical protein
VIAQREFINWSDIISNMFCILPCATIKDKVTLSPVGSAANIAKPMDETRSELRKLSDMDYLLPKLQEG